MNTRGDPVHLSWNAVISGNSDNAAIATDKPFQATEALPADNIAMDPRQFDNCR